MPGTCTVAEPPEEFLWNFFQWKASSAVQFGSRGPHVSTLLGQLRNIFYYILINLSSNCHIWLVASMWKSTNLGR